MKWFNFESDERKYEDCETEGMLVYLSPEALKHAIVVNDLEVFHNSHKCINGGRLLEVHRQYTYNLRQVAELIEEPLEMNGKADTIPFPGENTSKDSNLRQNPISTS